MECMYSEPNYRIALSMFRQIESAIVLIRQWNADIRTIDDYLNTPAGMQVLSATCMQLQAIGEGVKNIDKHTRGELLPQRTDIPWKLVMGLRDHIAHGYFEIDAEIILNTVRDDLEPLLSVVRFFISELEK